MADHRQDYSPTKLLINGQRMTDDYDVDDAVQDYMAMHPEADLQKVREEVEQAAAG